MVTGYVTGSVYVCLIKPLTGYKYLGCFAYTISNQLSSKVSTKLCTKLSTELSTELNKLKES